MAKVTTKSGSARVGVELTGLDEIDKTLSRMPIEVRGTEFKKAFRKELKRIAKRAQQLAPASHGPLAQGSEERKHLRDTIGEKITEYRGGAVLVGITGPEYPAGAHGHLVEAGTKPHEITVKKKKVLANKETKQVFGRTVRHPGARSQPFMAPAAQELAPTIEANIVAALDRAISRAASRG